MFTTDFGLGTLIGNLSSGYGSGRWARDRMKKRELDWMDDEMMARVEASKAAGLHPLVGLGVSGLGSMPQVNSPAPQFRYQSDAKVDPDTQRLRKAQADLAELQVMDAQRRLAGQPGNQGGAVITESDEFGMPAPARAQTGQYRVQPATITSVSRSIPYQTAGPRGASETAYGFRNPVTGEVMQGSLPAKDISEPLEGMGEFWKAIIGTPMGGKLLWDVMIPDEWKARLFDSIEQGLKNLSLDRPKRKGGFGSGSSLR